MAKQKEQKMKINDPFYGDPNLDTYFADYKERSEFSEEELERMSANYLTKAMRLMNDERTRDSVLKVALGGNKVEGPATAVAGIISKVDDSMRKADKRLPDEHKFVIASVIMGHINELAEAATGNPMTPEEEGAALAQAVNIHMKNEIQAGRVDPERLAERAGESISLMSDEQRDHVDAGIKQHYEVATAAKNQHFEQMANKPQQPKPLEGI